MKEEDLITEPEAARLLGKSYAWLRYRRRKTTRCPPYVILDNKVIRYSREALIRWIEDSSRFVVVNPSTSR